MASCEGIDSSVILPLPWYVVAVTLSTVVAVTLSTKCMSTFNVQSLYTHMLSVSQTFIAGAARQGGDADSS